MYHEKSSVLYYGIFSDGCPPFGTLWSSRFVSLGSLVQTWELLFTNTLSHYTTDGEGHIDDLLHPFLLILLLSLDFLHLIVQTSPSYYYFITSYYFHFLFRQVGNLVISFCFFAFNLKKKSSLG